MKRQLFRIISTAGHDATKNAWNSANRQVEAFAKALAVENGADYRLTASESFIEHFVHVRGSRTWTNSKTGESVVFSITKEA